MTPLSKPVRRRVEVRERGRAVPRLYTVELTQDGVRMRQYGARASAEQLAREKGPGRRLRRFA